MDKKIRYKNLTNEKICLYLYNSMNEGVDSRGYYRLFSAFRGLLPGRTGRKI